MNSNIIENDNTLDDDYLEHLISQIKRELDKKISDFSNINQLIDRKALLPFAKWTERPYTRVCLFENKAFELILICWNPMAQTTIHDHNEQSCRVFFFDSPFQETIYCDQGEKTLSIRNIQSGASTCMKKGRACHSLKNISNHKVMTLHLYNEPIKSCRTRRQEEVQMEEKILKYDFQVKDLLKQV